MASRLPAHDERVQEFGFKERLVTMPDLRVTETLDYLEFPNLMANARLMLIGSCGLQEETTILGVPA
ncbi:MAG: UDP-N-acetylglucosamine 2-epimerase [Chloroflexota bacterium]|nr:UDP-N-acetylglucosamine 2-epimerase [Chloroflexota bacterium]